MATFPADFKWLQLLLFMLEHLFFKLFLKLMPSAHILINSGLLTVVVAVVHFRYFLLWCFQWNYEGSESVFLQSKK